MRQFKKKYSKHSTLIKRADQFQKVSLQKILKTDNVLKTNQNPFFMFQQERMSLSIREFARIVRTFSLS